MGDQEEVYKQELDSVNSKLQVSLDIHSTLHAFLRAWSCLLLFWCFTAFQHFSVNFGHGQFNLPTLFLGKSPLQFTST